MRQLYINGVLATMPPGASIPYEKLNPAFNELGSHTMDFLILLTDEIKIALSWPHRITSTLKTTATVELKFNDADFIKGTLIVKTITNGKTAQCYMGSEEGDFYMQGQKINMRDINFGTDVTLGTTSQEVANYASATVTKAYPLTNFNFPIINNPELYGMGGQINPDYNNLMNGGWNSDYDVFVINSINEDPIKDNPYTLVPFLYLFFVIGRLLYHLNFKPLGSFWTNNDFKKLLLYNNYPLDWNEKKYYVRATTNVNNVANLSTHNILINDESTVPNEDDQSLFHNSETAIYDIAAKGYYTFNINYLIECTTSGNIALEIRSLYTNSLILTQNFSFTTGETRRVTASVSMWLHSGYIGTQMKYYSNTSQFGVFIIKPSSYITVNNDSYCALNQFSRILHYANHVPDMLVGDFMKQVELMFGHVSFIDNIRREHRLMSYNDIFNGNVINDITTNVLVGIQTTYETLKTLQGFTFENDGFADNNFLNYSDYENLGDYVLITDLPTPIQEGKIAIVLQLNKIYITKLDAATNSIRWIVLTDDFIDVSTGDVSNDELDLKTLFAPILMDDNSAEFELYRLLPHIKNMATSPTFKTGTNDMPLRLMYYYGLKARIIAGNSYNIPYASSFNYFVDGTDLGTMPLTIADINEQFLSKYITWLTTEHKPVIFNAIFTSRQIRDLKMWEKFRITINNTAVIGFIKRISTNIFADHLDICEVEFLPI